MRKVSLPMVAAMAAMTLRDIGAGNSTQAIPELTPYTKSRPKKKTRTRFLKEGAEIMRKAQAKRSRKRKRRKGNQLARDIGQYEGWGQEHE